MKFNLLDLLIIIGILQGFILGAIIFYKRGKNQIPSITIACLLFVFALACIGSLFIMLPSSEIIRALERYIPFFLTFLPGPLTYFHVKSAINPTFRYSKRDSWHFSPAIINLAPALLCIAYLILNQLGISLEQKYLDNTLYFLFRYTDVPAWFHITFYLILSKRYLLKNVKNKKTYYSWLNYFINSFLVFQAIWFPFMALDVSPYNYLLVTHGWVLYLLYILLAALTYWIGLKYLMDVLNKLSGKNSLVINPVEIRTLQSQLNELLIQKKLFKDPELSLSKVADILGTTPKKISYLLNQQLNISFNDYINKQRINEVKTKLHDPSFNNLTIAAIALNAGFSSIPTFQRTFKAVEKMTPKEFKKKVQIMI